MSALEVLTLLPLAAALGVAAWLARRVGDARVHLLTATLTLGLARHLLSYGNTPGAAAWLPRTPEWVPLVVGVGTGVLAVFSLVVVSRILSGKSRALAEAHQSHEQRVQDLVEAAQEGMWAVDPDGHTTFANRAVHDLLGLEPGSLVGQPMTARLAPAYREAATRFLAQGQNQGHRVIETALVHASGREVWVRMKTSPLLDGRGGFEGALATVADITLPRQQERDAQARRQMIESIARGDALPATLERLCRYVEERSPGVLCSIVLHDEERGVLRTGAAPSLPAAYVAAVDGAPVVEGLGSCGTAIATGRPQQAEDLRTHPHWRGLEAHTEPAGLRACWSTPITSSTRAVLGSFALYWRHPNTPSDAERAMVESGTHIAALAIERERTEGQLQRTMALLHAALEACPAGIVVISPVGQVQIRNRAAERILGQALPVGSLLSEAARWTPHHPDGTPMPVAHTPTVRALERGDVTTNEEVVVLLEDGTRRHLLSSAAPVRRDGGPPLAAIVVFLDVSEIKAGEREREQLLATLASQRDELESIFRATSHDLLSPLVNIEGFSRELEHASAELRAQLDDPDLPPALGARIRRILDEDVEPSLGFVCGSVEKMERLLAGLKTLSRTGTVPVAPADVDMDRLLRGLLADLEFKARQARVHVELEPVPACHADPDLLARVFTNLVDNALKYRHPEREPRVRIEGRRRGERVEVRVVDNGLGIPEPHRARVFEPFERPGTAAEVPGEGLGLAIVANILQRNDGRVTVEDTPGGGSTFVVELPAARVARPAPPVPSSLRA